MPNRHYIPASPPRWYDSILAHPYPIVFSVMSMALGLWIIGGAIFGYSVSVTLEQGDRAIRSLAASPAVIGGFVTLAGLAYRRDKLASFFIEGIGVVAMAGAWLCYAILLSSGAGGLHNVPPWGIIACFLTLAHAIHGASLGLSVWRLYISEKAMRPKGGRGEPRSADH